MSADKTCAYLTQCLLTMSQIFSSVSKCVLFKTMISSKFLAEPNTKIYSYGILPGGTIEFSWGTLDNELMILGEWTQHSISLTLLGLQLNLSKFKTTFRNYATHVSSSLQKHMIISSSHIQWSKVWFPVYLQSLYQSRANEMIMKPFSSKCDTRFLRIFSSPKNSDDTDTRKICTHRALQTYPKEQKKEEQHGQTNNREEICYQIKTSWSCTV
jgi:hypothetical protein